MASVVDMPWKAQPKSYRSAMKTNVDCEGKHIKWNYTLVWYAMVYAGDPDTVLGVTQLENGDHNPGYPLVNVYITMKNHHF